MVNYRKRYLANIVIEADTPLKVGSSDIDMLQDAPVQKDWNELPMILGTSIAGVLRKEFDDKFADDIFGTDCSKISDKSEKSRCLKNQRASRLIISNALLCDENMKVSESLLFQKSNFLKIFDNLPIREHTAITDKGVAKINSKFDEEVVYKGSRFKFRLELVGDESDEDSWRDILKTINSKIFRLGGGTTKGFGDIKVLTDLSSWDILDIDSKEYREKDSSLNTTFSRDFLTEQKEIKDYISYQLLIKPDNFFMFGSGFGDDDADVVPVYEEVVDYEKKSLSKKKILIPASSIKGAISHRVTYYYNLQNRFFVGSNDARDKITEIFGQEKISDENLGFKGRVLFSDCFVDDNGKRKVFDHVKIDRFRGGASEGALFQEKSIFDDREYKIDILLKKEVKDEYIKPFELALKDICNGMLSLGGATTKGHGVFSGRVLKDGVEI